VTGYEQPPRDGAEALRQRLGQALAERAILHALTIGLAIAAFAILVARIATPTLGRYWLFAGLAMAIAICWVVGRFRSARQTPSYAQCLAAVDSASHGGGLLMAGDAARRAGWDTNPLSASVPEVIFNPGRALWPPILVAAVIVAVLTPSSNFFARTFNPPREDGIQTLLEEEVQRLEVYREQEVVDDETADRIQEWLESAKAGDEHSTGELLEILDQVKEELDKAGEEAATAADEAQDAALAAAEMTDQLSRALESGALDESSLAAAAEAMREFLQESGLQSDVLSNLLASASSGALSAEMLSALSNELANASSAASDRLRQLTEADIQKLSKCNGGNGCCTNGAAALAALLARNAESAACAAALAEMCGEPGEGGIGKGYARSELTWRDPASKDGTESKETSLGGGMRSGDDGPRLIGVSASAPQDDGKADVAPGKLGEAQGAAGDARTPVVLPRHREAVRKYLGDGK
jgi:hypothetical protein